MFSVLMKSQKQEQYAKVFLLKLKNYITMWVPLSSRPSPRHFQVEIGKVVEKADVGA